MDIMIKVVAIAIISMVFSIVLKKVLPEFSFLLTITVGLCIFFLLQYSIETILHTMLYLAEISQIDQNLLTPIFKTVAISIITKITGEICRSAGEQGIATSIDIAGTIVSLVIALPLIEGVINMMTDML